MSSDPSLSQTTPSSSFVQMAIETTGTSGSLAILQGDNTYRAIRLPDGHRTASSLAPAMKDLLEDCESSGLKVNLVSVAVGPGSFTGLRVGITTAKTFCYARRLPLVAVDSLAAIAASVMVTRQDASEILVGLNAYRRQIFAAQFRREVLLGPIGGREWSPFPDAVAVLEEDAWGERLAKSSPGVLLAGDAKIFGAHARTADFYDRESADTVDAIGVGLLGRRLAGIAKFADPMALVPRYLKASSAEEKLKA